MEKTICSYCGNNVFTEIPGGSIGGVVGGVVPLSGKFTAGEQLYYSVCVKCGTVNRTYVKNPSRLVVKSDNKFI